MHRISLPISVTSCIVAYFLYFLSRIQGEYNASAVAALAISSFFLCYVTLQGALDNGGLLRLTMGIYFLILYIFPGMLHSASDTYPYFGILYASQYVELASRIVLAYAFGVFVGNFVAPEARRDRCDRCEPNEKTHFAGLQTAGALPIIIAATLSFLLAAAIGLDLFIRKRSDLISSPQASSEYLILLVGIAKNLGIVSFVAALHRCKLSGLRAANIWLLVLCISVNAVVNYPLSTARFTLFGLALITLHVVFDVTKPKVKVALLTLSLLAVSTIFPFLSFLQRGAGDASFDWDVIRYFRSGGDLDGFQSTINVAMMTADKGILWGWQILGSVLFFVPRSLWQGKAAPTGSAAAEYAGYDFYNVSSPLPAEAYSDFGFLGCLVVGFATGYIGRKFDLKYSASWEKNSLRSTLYFGGCVGFLVIFLRGPILGVIAPIVTYFILARIMTGNYFSRRESRE